MAEPAKPRSLESFGVAGLLAEGCTVFYSSLFTLRHVGRVTDLIVARLSGMGPDDLSLRATLLYSLYDAYRSQAKGTAEPLVVECGHDTEQAAIGVAFTFAATDDIKKFTDPAVRERILKRQATNAFEAMLVAMIRHSHRLVVRVQPSIRRVEIANVVPFKVKSPAGTLFDLVVIGQNAIESPKVAEYVEIGDLDYPKLLSEDSPAQQMPAARTGEILASTMTSRGRAKEDNSLAESLRTIRGTTEHLKDEKTVVKGTPVAGFDNTVLKVSTGSASSQGDDEDSPRVRLMKDQIAELQKKLAMFESEQATASTRVAASSADDEETAGGQESGAKRAGLLKKIWPFSRVDAESAAEEEESQEDTGPDETVASESAPVAEAKPASTEEVAAPAAESSALPINADAAVKSLMVEIQTGSLDRAISRATREAAEHKREMASGKTKKWIDAFLAELTLEKARLLEMSKKLNATVRAKDVEFRNREHTLQEELKRRDDLVRQKNSALARAKEQIAQVNMSLERAKSNAHAGGGDDAHFKVKFQQTQKLLSVFKEENETLRDKVEELKNSLGNAQFAAAAKKGPSALDHAALQAKHDKAQRMADEFRRQNQILMDKLSERDKRTSLTSAGSHEDTRRRLEAAMKLITVTKKDAERLTLKVDEQEREKERLQRELIMLQAELRAVKAGRGGGSGGSGGTGAAGGGAPAGNAPAGGLAGGKPPAAA